MKTEKKGIIFILLICLILCGLVTVVVISLKQDTIEENLQKDFVIKTLLVLEDDNKALFTNLVIYYPETGKGALINIPGNTGGLHKTIDRVDRIDTIYTELGIESYKDEIASLVNVEIPFYMQISLDNFVQLADLLEGLEIFIPMPIDLDSADGQKWLLPSGRVKLDGDKVKTFLTYSVEDESDEEILSRKQDAIVAFFSAIKSKANLYLTDSTFTQISSRIKTNVKYKDFLTLFLHLSQVDTERFAYISVTGQDRNVDGKNLLMPFRNGEYIKDVVKKGINSIVSLSGTVNSRPYVMRILNGTKIKGLAHNTRILLQGAAFEVLDIGNVELKDDEEVEETYIIDHIGQLDAAKAIGDFIHCTKINVEEIKDSDNESVSNVDFTLVLGQDFDGRWVSPKKQTSKK